MKLFLDTNIFPEFIDRRAQYDDVCGSCGDSPLG